jgi:MFS family permease
MARIVRPDIFLVAGAVVACFAAAWVTLRGRERRGASYGMSALFGAATGLAVLSKGPLGLAIPVVFAALVGARERRFPFRDAAGAAVALLALAATIGAWLLPVLHHPGGAAYLHDMLHQKDLETGVAQHARPFYFYLGPFAGGFAPFLIFLGLGAHDEVRPRFRPTPALVMAALLFLLFSAIPGKRWHYLLPIYPFAALVAAAAVDRRFERHRLWRAVPLGIAAVLIAGSVAYYALLPIGRTLPFGKKIFDDNRARDFATAVEGCVPKDREVGSVRTFAEAIAFVGRRHVRELWTPEAAARWLAEDPSRCVAISRAERPALERAFGAPLVTLFEEEPTGAGGKADRMDALHCVVRPAAN